MQKKEETNNSSSNLVEQMFAVGAHYGYGKSRRHPSTAKYVYATKNKSDIIDLEKTEKDLEKAVEFVKGLAEKDKTVLFVGTKPEAREAILAGANSVGMPYVIERWIGGTLSNFGEIKKRINELETLQKETETGEIKKYTKKEQLKIAKKLEKLSLYYAGLLSLKRAPDAMFIIDAREEKIARIEANKTNVPVIALVNTDTDIKKIEFPIVANDSATPSIKFFTQKIVEAYKNNIKKIN